MNNEPAKIQIQVRDIVAHCCFRALVNRTPLTRIVLMDGHKEIPLQPSAVKQFLFTGLNNLDFFITGYGAKIDMAEYDKLSDQLDFDSAREAERSDIAALEKESNAKR